MTGMTYMILGGLCLIASTVGFTFFQIYMEKKKRKLREEYYQSYE